MNQTCEVPGCDQPQQPGSRICAVHDGQVFTPRDEEGNRLLFLKSDVTVLQGSLGSRGSGLHALVQIAGSSFRVYGASCGLPNCMCDAIIKPEREMRER